MAHSRSGDGSGMNRLASNANEVSKLLSSYQTDNAMFLSVQSVAVRQCLDRYSVQGTSVVGIESCPQH